MDDVTQRNAVVVQEASMASQRLAGEAVDLARLVGQLRIEASGETFAATRTDISRKADRHLVRA
jgi:hypothetical protein